MPDQAPKLVSLPGVEILTTGEHKGVPISRRDLDDMVEAFAATAKALPVDVRLGHDARQAWAKALFGDKGAAAAATDEGGWPALGWISGLRRSGDVLVADFEDVPERLAGWIKSKRYRTRSAGIRFNKRVGDKVYRWMLDHVALLGGETPAVPGLSDIGLSEPADGDLIEVVFGLDLAEGEDDAETALARFIASLEALFDDHAALLYNRKGAPRVRSLFQAFKADLRAAARDDVPPRRQGNLSDPAGADGAAGNQGAFSMPTLREALSLKADATADEVGKALADLSADAPECAGFANFVSGMDFETADQLAVWLAGSLGVPPGDLGALAGRLADLLGMEGPDAAGPADPAADPAAGGNMSDKTDPNTTDPNEARILALSERNVELAERVVQLEARAARDAAERRVAADEARLGVGFAKPVRDTLLELAAGDAASVKRYAALVESVQGVPTGERGTSGPAENGAALILSDDDRETIRRFNLSEDSFRAARARRLGIPFTPKAGA